MSKSILLLAFIVASCGKNNSNSNHSEINQNQNSEDISTTADEAIKRERLAIEQTIQSIIDDVNSSKLSKIEGMNKIAELIGRESLQNAGDESILKIAKAIIHINDNVSQNLEVLFGLEGISLEGLNESLVVENIFLNLAQSGFDHSVAMDRVLISYVNLLINSSKNRINDIEILRYFSMRFQYLRQLRGMESSDLIAQYSTLSDLISPEKLFVLFGEGFESLKINNNHSYSTRKLFGILLSQKLLASKKISFQKTLFDSAANNARWAIKNMGQELSAMYYSARIVSDYFSLFDRLEKNDSKNALIEAIDYRSENIAYELYQKLKEFSKNGVEVDKLFFNHNHPYVELYLSKALANDNFNYRNVEEYEASFYNRLSNYNLGAASLSPYLKGYYDVELKKQFLSSQTIDSDERQAVYDSLLSSLIETLNEREGKYELSLEKLRTAKERKDLYYSIALGNSSSDTEQTYLKKYCEDTNCQKQVFKAGIHIAPFNDIENKNIEIYAKDIRFTPLSMIYAPGGNVLINARNIENLWIDTSGLHGTSVGFLEEDNQVMYPKSNCSTVDYNFGKNTRNGKVKTCKIQKSLMQAQAQPQGGDIYDLQINGKNAGRITLSIHYDGKIDGVPLLASRGGNGADGKTGLRAAPKGKTCQESFTFDIGELKTWEANVEVSGVDFDMNSGHTRYIPSYRWVSKSIGEIKSQTYTITKSRGGKGGDAGNGARPFFQIATSESMPLLNNTITDAGSAGVGGESGECGAGSSEEFKGKDGKEGTTL